MMTPRYSLQAALLALALVFAASQCALADTVMITGANTGIGLEFAAQYAAKGWTVIATHRRPQTPASLADLAAPGTRACASRSST